MITYDHEVDAMYVYLIDGESRTKVARTRWLDNARSVDFAEDGSVLGVELLGVTQGIDLDGIPERASVEEQLRALRQMLNANNHIS